jgi:hypothetical protein
MGISASSTVNVAANDITLSDESLQTVPSALPFFSKISFSA